MGGGAAGGLWRHQQWQPSWILPRIKNQVKTARNGNFCALHELHFSHKIYFNCWKNMYFHSKFAWQPATYDVISHSHSNWPSLNLSQNLRKGWTNSYWKRQVFMFYPLRKNSEKPYGGEGGGVASTPLLVRPRGLINKVSNDACQCQWNGHDAVISTGGIFFYT